jgi:hypothetical protein
MSSFKSDRFEETGTKQQEVMLTEDEAKTSGAGLPMILQSRDSKGQVIEPKKRRDNKFQSAGKKSNSRALTDHPHPESLRSPLTSPSLSPVHMNDTSGLRSDFFSLTRTLSGLSSAQTQGGSSQTNAEGEDPWKSYRYD